MWTESSKVFKCPNIHVRVGWYSANAKFVVLLHSLNPVEFDLQVLNFKKEQQYVLNKFIKTYGCIYPNFLISLLTYPINIDRLYLQSNESDSVELTILPMCLTISDHCTGNPLIDTCLSILILGY